MTDGDGPLEAPRHQLGPHVIEGPMPSWVTACVWRLLSPPCRLGEVSNLSCEAVSALCCTNAEKGPPTTGPSAGHPGGALGGFSDLLIQWQKIEAQARDAEGKDSGASGGPQLPPQDAEEAQKGAEDLLATYGAPYGVICSSSEERIRRTHDDGTEWRIGLGLCNCALWRLHAATLRCTDTSLGASASCADPLLCLPSDHWGPQRLLLTITGEMQTAQAAAEKRLLWLSRLLRAQCPPLTLPAAKPNARQYVAGVACVLEELRASRLPLLLHPKSSEAWSLRRQQLRVCVRGLQHQLLAQVMTDPEAGPCCCLGPLVSAEPLRREYRELVRDNAETEGWEATSQQGAVINDVAKTLASHDGVWALLLLLLESELRLSSWHLKSRSHSYQAAEHAHRVLQLFLTEVSAAADAAAAADDERSGSTQRETAASGEQQLQQAEPNVSGLLLRLLSAAKEEERRFWRYICQTVPSHFAGGQQLLRLLALDLHQLLQQQLAAAAPLEASWLVGQLNPGGPAAARAAETAEQGRRVLRLFPTCEAAWRLCTYAIVALMDWAVAAISACKGPQEALQAAVLTPLNALVEAESRWAAQMPASLFSKRHVETLAEELQLLQSASTPGSS